MMGSNGGTMEYDGGPMVGATLGARRTFWPTTLCTEQTTGRRKEWCAEPRQSSVWVAELARGRRS